MLSHKIKQKKHNTEHSASYLIWGFSFYYYYLFAWLFIVGNTIMACRTDNEYLFIYKTHKNELTIIDGKFNIV